MKPLRPSESEDKKNVLRLDDRSFEELIKIGTLTIAKCWKQSFPVSVFYYATLLGH